MGEFVFSLAHEARRTSLVAALRQQPTLTLAKLDALLAGAKYGDDLARITVAELFEPKQRATAIWTGETPEDTILRVFRAQPDTWLTSGFFTRHWDMQRWTAQAALAKLAEQGLLVRKGKTSATRYSLASQSSPGDR